MRLLNNRAMIVTWSLLFILNVICQAESKCSPTSYYKNCWIRRFPGLYIDINASQHTAARLLHLYREDSAPKCSRACCLTRNFSCNMAVYHYNTTQDTVNCFHLHCPTLDSCVLRQRGDVILYNVTQGVDPDLLVFGKYLTSNARVLPQEVSPRPNASEPIAPDKRHFNRPHVAATTGRPPTNASSTPPSATATPRPSGLPLFTRSSVSAPPTQDTWDALPASPVGLSSTTQKRSTQAIPTHDITNTSPHLTTNASARRTSTAPPSSTQILQVLRTSTAPQTSTQHSSIIFSTQTGSASPPQLTSTAVPVVSTLPTSDLPALSQHASPVTTTWAPSTANTTNETTSTNVSAWTDLSTSRNLRDKVTTTTTQFASAQVSSTDATSAHTTVVTAEHSSTFEPSTPHFPTTVKTLPPYVTTQPNMQNYTSKSTQSQEKERSYTTTTWPYTELTSTLSPVPPPTEDVNQSPTTDGLPQVFNTSNTTATDYSMNPFTPTASTTPSLPASVTNNILNTSLTPQNSMEESQPHPNDTKGYISRNITTGDRPHPGADEGLTPAWHLAANTILVALATCGTVAFGCCCSVLMAVSWRGRRQRKGRYQTSLRGKRGSMQLIKYVIVRESFPKTGSVL
ncbi:uncharacterized protein mansc4 [Brachyhypopomus gauderio]|uniref:uncharacterized protein mansc4 n=1 Tax=Brachyhypopomus gauderio TaxID=698409 RepID=UPI0040415F77